MAKLLKNMSKTEKLIAGVQEVLGATEVPSKNRYRIFKKGSIYLLIGRAGALRSNDRPTASGSRVSAYSPDKIVEEWERRQREAGRK